MKKDITKINFLYILSFFGDALFSPFLALYFISLNFSDVKRGVLLALIPAASLLGNYIYGNLSGKLKRNLIICRILALINCIIMFPFGYINNFYFLLVLTIIFALHNNSFFTIQDGLAVKYSQHANSLYSITRMFGSIGYFAALILGGFIGDKIDFKYLFVIASIFYLLSTIVLFIIQPFDNELEEKKSISYKELFKNKQFIKYIIFYGLIIGVWNIGEAYCSTFFNSLGVSKGQWSYLYAAQVGIEIITILICKKILRKSTSFKIALVTSSCLIAIRYLLLSIPMNIYILVTINAILRGMSWGLLLSSHIQLLKCMLGSDLTTKGVSLLAMEVNIFASIGDLVSPYIYLNIGFNYMYLIFGIIQILGIIVLFTIDFSFLNNDDNYLEK